VASQQPAVTTPAAQAGPVQQQPTHGKQTPGPAAGGGTTGRPPVLTDGTHNAFIRKLDPRARTVVVDVVQVFTDKAAVEAAVQDGRSREDAQYLSVWVRNQNPRLRTLPLASGFKVNLTGGCEDSTLSREALLQKLAANARIAGVYYYTLTVKDGAVQRIDEHLAINAC
jgi:cell division septal protein FtsQ